MLKAHRKAEWPGTSTTEETRPASERHSATAGPQATKTEIRPAGMTHVGSHATKASAVRARTLPGHATQLQSRLQQSSKRRGEGRFFQASVREATAEKAPQCPERD